MDLKKETNSRTADFPPSDTARKLSVVKQSFDHVRNMSVHEDEKAGRILTLY